MKKGDVCRVKRDTACTIPAGSVVQVIEVQKDRVIVSNGFFSLPTNSDFLEKTEPPNGMFCHDPLKCTQAGRCIKPTSCAD